jgi:glyoxylase I family protein
MESLFTLEHIGLASQNPVALKDWYLERLGATLVFEMRQTPPAFLINLGGMMIEIYSANDRSDVVQNNRLAGWRHLALKVTSIESVRDHLATKGIVFSEEIKSAGGGGRVLFFNDLEGNLLHLTERLPNGFQ